MFYGKYLDKEISKKKKWLFLGILNIFVFPNRYVFEILYS